MGGTAPINDIALSSCVNNNIDVLKATHTYDTSAYFLHISINRGAWDQCFIRSCMVMMYFEFFLIEHPIHVLLDNVEFICVY